MHSTSVFNKGFLYAEGVIYRLMEGCDSARRAMSIREPEIIFE